MASSGISRDASVSPSRTGLGVDLHFQSPTSSRCCFDFGFQKNPCPSGRGRGKRMTHKIILFLLFASALIRSNLVEAQQPKKVTRICYLGAGRRFYFSNSREAISRTFTRDRLRRGAEPHH